MGRGERKDDFVRVLIDLEEILSPAAVDGVVSRSINEGVIEWRSAPFAPPAQRVVSIRWRGVIDETLDLRAAVRIRDRVIEFNAIGVAGDVKNRVE